MNTSKGHKIFSLVMLFLILGTIVFATIIGAKSIYDYKQQTKALTEEPVSEVTNDDN